MKINTYEFTDSSFLSIDKDMSIIVDKIFKNDRLKKLLYYTTPDCLEAGKYPKLDAKQTAGLFGKQIRIVPKLTVDSSVLNYIIIDFDNFIPNETNPEFRNNSIDFDIISHFDQWHLKDYQLRPYKIAAELDSMFNKKQFTGIGKLKFISAKKLTLNDEFGGISIRYAAIHGDEDKRDPLTPFEEGEQGWIIEQP